MSCTPPSGTLWNTPIPGNLVAVPPGSTVIQTPSCDADCGCQSEQGAGLVASQQVAASASAGFQYPVTAANFDAPSINTIGQLVSSGASKWAQPGGLIWLSAYGAYLQVVGVSGDIVSFKNVSLTPGTTVLNGTVLTPDAPANTSGSNPENVTRLQYIMGTLNGANVLIGGNVGDVLVRKADTSGEVYWERENLALTRWLSGQPTLLEIKRDVVASTHATNRWANPVVSTINQSAPTGNISFPSFPTLSTGQTIKALVQVKWKFAVKAASAFRLKVTINGVEWQNVAYCPAVTAAATAAASATFNAELNNKGPEGIAQFIIPVPSDNTQVNVVIDARRASDTTAPLDDDAHYIATFKVLAYIY